MSFIPAFWERFLSARKNCKWLKWAKGRGESFQWNMLCYIEDSSWLLDPRRSWVFHYFFFSRLYCNSNMKKTGSNVNDSYPCKMGKGKKEVWRPMGGRVLKKCPHRILRFLKQLLFLRTGPRPSGILSFSPASWLPLFNDSLCLIVA